MRQEKGEMQFIAQDIRTDKGVAPCIYMLPRGAGVSASWESSGKKGRRSLRERWRQSK